MSSKRRIRRLQHRSKCGNKIGYQTQTECVINLIKMQRNFHDPYLASYKCPFCGLWHYGHRDSIKKKLIGLSNFFEGKTMDA